MRVYISGPMRGIKFFNFPVFDAARDWLIASGHDVVSPADLDRAAGFDPFTFDESVDWDRPEKLGFSLELAAVRDFHELIKCDAIMLLHGWEKSKGATAEKAIAEWLNIKVMFDCRCSDEAFEDVLDEAMRITKGDRNAQYGPPQQDFERVATMWSALKGVEFTQREVAMFMICLKLSRETHQRKRDNWVDIAGYARCGSMC